MSDLSLTSTRDAVLFMGSQLNVLLSKIHTSRAGDKGVSPDIRVDRAV
jgi:hypothetical protein